MMRQSRQIWSFVAALIVLLCMVGVAPAAAAQAGTPPSHSSEPGHIIISISSAHQPSYASLASSAAKSGITPALAAGGWSCGTYTFANKWTNPLRFAVVGLLTGCSETIETVDVTFDLYFGVQNGNQIVFAPLGYWHGCTFAPALQDASYYCPDFGTQGVSAWTLNASPGDIWGVLATWKGYQYDGTSGAAQDFQYVTF